MKKTVILVFILMLCLAFGTMGLAEDTTTVQDARGEVSIPKNPERVVDLSGNSDILAILGYKVVGTANSDAYDYTKFPSFLEDTLKGAKILGYSYQDTMDVENIIALNPDLIIISTRQEKMYDALKKVAPTVMLELAQKSWQEDMLTVGKIFGKEDVAQQWLDNYKAKAKKLGEAILAQKGEDFAPLSFLASGGQLYVFADAGFGAILYNDLMLPRPEGLPSQADVELPIMTVEGLAGVNANYIFALATEADQADLEANPIWKALPAVASTNLTLLPASPWFNQGYSCIGAEAMLSDIATWLNVKVD